MKATINIKGTEIAVISKGKNDDFISLTDIAKYKNPADPRFVIQNWMRTRFTIEFMGYWEQMYNPNFNRVEFEAVKNEAGSNSFVMTPTKWVELTHAIGVYSKAGRYGGTFAHKDIAFEFASWISAEFKLYVIKVLSNLESMNAELVKQGFPQSQRLLTLNTMAIEQMTSILGCATAKQLQEVGK